MPAHREVTVIGAGIVGLCCARWLQHDGHRVRLMERDRPAAGASSGNAGVFAVDSVVPLATPATLRALPAMLLAPGGPVALRWRSLPSLLPWLIAFLGNARPARVEATARTLAALCGAARGGLDPLVRERPAARLMRDTGWLTAYESEAALHAAEHEIALRRRLGVGVEMLDTDGLRERVPQLAPHVAGGVLYPDCWMCSDPEGLVAALARDFEAAGGTLERLMVHTLAPAGSGVRIDTDAGPRSAQHVVVAAGAHSRPLAAALGDRVPLDTERGYHAMLPAPGVQPPLPVMSGEGKFVATPMDAGLRLAGTSELGGLDRPPTPGRAEALLRRATRLFPGLDTRGWTPWMGCRPTLPDSLPVIGRSPRCPAVSYAFGHQHLGLTLAGITGKLVADELAGRRPEIDLQPLRADRF